MRAGVAPAVASPAERVARAADGPSPDTIAAVATPPGAGAVGVVRISGPAAGSIARRVVPGIFGPDDSGLTGSGQGDSGLADPGAPAPRTAHLADVLDPESGEVVDRGLVTLFPAPASYTGEDVVEVSGHGGVLAPRLVLEAMLRAGARQAEAGEFTRRAYLNGKLDLVQAEAVLDLVEGRSRALHRVAVHQLERGLSRRVAELRGRVVELEALLAHHLDFPDEDAPPTPVSAIGSRAEALADALEALGRTAPEGALLRSGARVVLAGAPNVGKSSLFNALTGEERALVTEVAGTTRDAVDVEVSLGGYPFRLVDTAGLRETDEVVERMGIEVARRYLAGADVVLFCAEAGTPLDDGARAFLGQDRDCPVVLVWTKADLGERAGPGADSAGPFGGLPPSEEGGPGRSLPDGVTREVTVSVRSGRGLDTLRALLPELVFAGVVTAEPETPFVTRERQAREVGSAEAEIRSFAQALREGIPPEVASAHLKSATSHLESVVGVVTGEDVLDHLFRQFCIGK